MFESIKHNWGITEAEILRKNFTDMLTHISDRGGLSSPEFVRGVAEVVDGLRRKHEADPFQLSESKRREIAKRLHTRARKLGRRSHEWFFFAAALSVVSMALKSTYLPGDDAAFVRRECGDIIDSATGSATGSAIKRVGDVSESMAREMLSLYKAACRKPSGTSECIFAHSMAADDGVEMTVDDEEGSHVFRDPGRCCSGRAVKRSL